MPEGDTVYRSARALHRALAGKPVTRFETEYARLAGVDADHPIKGRIVERVEAHGKWLLIAFSGDLVLLSHMLMNGRWHIYRIGERWLRRRSDMRIVIEAEDWMAVGFRIPVAEFHSSASMARRMAGINLGPDLLRGDFDSGRVAAEIHLRAGDEIGSVLLDQQVVAGIGNVFKSEICFACGVSPFLTVASLTEPQIAKIVAVSQKFLRANVNEAIGTSARRTTGSLNPAVRLWVYGRRGEPCRRCGAPIEARKQGAEARVTFWCPNCQAM